jgi:hypothetical protein
MKKSKRIETEDVGSNPIQPVVICEFLYGYLAALQFVVVWHGMDSIAEDAMRESGYGKEEFLKAQKRTGFEGRKMNSVIRNAFSR